MNQLLEWAPLLVFFLAFKFLDIYWATATLMVACLMPLIVHRMRTGQYKTMHVITAAVILLLGTATLLLHDKRFIQWKPTVLLGLTAAAFLGSMAIGKQPLARRLLEPVFEEPLRVTSRAWGVLNGIWALWFALLALLNIYVARNYAESVWVNFKVFGITLASMAFMIPQVLWLSSRIKPPAPAAGENHG